MTTLRLADPAQTFKALLSKVSETLAHAQQNSTDFLQVISQPSSRE